MTKSTLGGQRVYFTDSSIERFIVKSHESKTLEAVADVEVLTGLSPMTCSAYLLIEAGITSPGMAPPTGLGPTNQPLIKKMPYILTLWRHFLS